MAYGSSNPPKPGSTRARASHTDIDFKADGIRYDSKLNAKNINTRRAINWIHAAAHEAGGAPGGYRKVKILVPNVEAVRQVLKDELTEIIRKKNLGGSWEQFFDKGFGD